MENITFENQMTIFDYLEEEPAPDFKTMTDEAIAEYIGQKLGVRFQWSQIFEEYTAKVPGSYRGKRVNMMLSVHTSTYNLKDDAKNGQHFISCDISYNGGGAGSPCDSLEEAVRFFRKQIGG